MKTGQGGFLWRILLPILALLVQARALPAAPTITTPLVGPRPAQGRVGEAVAFSASGLAAPVHVFFSDGTNPVVEALPVVADVDRGVVVTRVPVGAATGYMKVTAAGVNSPPYYFRVDPSSYVQGTDVVSGEVTDGMSPVGGAVVFLFAGMGGCGGDGRLEDFTTSAMDGTYTLHGGDGDRLVLVFPPVASDLAAAVDQVALSGVPSTLDFALAGGALVTGTVVDADDPGTAVGHARIDFDSDAAGGHEETYADASGSFAVRLRDGDWKYEVAPPPGDAHASTRGNLLVSGSDVDLGDVELATGVRIFGTLTRAADGSPVAGAELRALVSDPCCSDVDDRLSAGDGSFVLTVPGSATYDVRAQFEGPATLADVRVGPLMVGMSDVEQDLAAADAAFITGTVTEAGTGDPIACLRIEARPASMGDFAGATTAADGTYRVRAATNANGYLVTTGEPDESGPRYATQTWNGTPGGTYFWCEGTPVAAANAGQITSGIDFVLPRSAAITGHISTQPACTDDLASTGFDILVDDGAPHACSMGVADRSYGPPGYRVDMLPPSALFASGLRACMRPQGYDPQCWDGQLSPAFDPISVAAEGSVAGVDFCLAACAMPVLWYQDDDADGFGDVHVFEHSCTQPPGWISLGGDCDDGDDNIHPFAQEVCNGDDDDCDGQTDEGNPGGGGACDTGLLGVCMDGTLACQSGALACVQDTPASAEICNDLDDDCDGAVDGFATSCGVGACAAAGTCTAGVDSCTPGSPAPADPTCNGVDDDCDGQPDENYAPLPTTCGVGACASAGMTSCVSGAVQDSCTPGAPAATDSTCDGTDDDCDGQVDDDYVATPTTCGVGACADAGATACVSGTVNDTCTPGLPGTESCNDVDDDCNGVVDDGVPGGCHLAVTSPVADAVLDCRPGAISPTITWDPAGYDRFIVYVAADEAFRRKVTSGRWTTATSWPVPPGRWRRACRLARTALYIRVQGLDVNLPRTDRARKAYSPAVAVTTQR